MFFVKTILRFGKLNIEKLTEQIYNFTPEMLKATGEALGIATWKLRNEVRVKKQGLEKLNSLEYYQQNFSTSLREFFNGLIIILKKKKHAVINKKRKQRNVEEKPFDITLVEKKVNFLISIILTITFPGINIWLTHIMSSLCRKLKLLSSLYTILWTANVISHTISHERQLEKIRTNVSKSEERLI